MTVVDEFGYFLLWVYTDTATLVLAYAGWKFYSLRKQYRADIGAMAADVSELFEILSMPIPHACRPPSFGGKAPDGSWEHPDPGSHWECVCGVRYVLIRYGRPTERAPFRLGWITTWEQRNGFRPAWDRQDPRARWDGPDLPGGAQSGSLS